MKSGWVLLILLLLPHSMAHPITPSYVFDSNTVGLYDIQTEFEPDGYMAFSLSIQIELTGFNESSVYRSCARSEKLVAVRFEFVEKDIAERWVLNEVMATSNVTEPQVDNETYIEWTEQLRYAQVGRQVENLQLGDNTFLFAVEFEIEFSEEPETALEEIRFGSTVHLDGLGSPLPFVLLVLGVGVIVIVGVVVFRLRVKPKLIRTSRLHLTQRASRIQNV